MKARISKGFSTLEVLLAIIVLCGIGASGFYVYSNRGKEATPVTETVKTYIKTTDSTQAFEFAYPDEWEVKPYVWESCCDGEPKTEPDWTKESKEITLQRKDNEKAVITIRHWEDYGLSWNSFEDIKTMVKEDYFAKILFDGMSDSGRNALFTRVDYLGPPDAKVESFTDHRYYYDNGTKYLWVEFREKYHHDWPDDEAPADLDNSQYMADFEYITKSIKFLK